MKVNVFNETNYDINIKYYKYFLYYSLKTADIDGEVNLLFCDNEYIKNLNKEFRNKDKATDVLTFPMGDIHEGGDIVISYEWVAARYSEERIKKTILKLIIHSILHLKGVHHNYSRKSLMENNEKMKELYERVIKTIKENRS
ncbi:putative metal-dependent hydrolase [Brachyspira hampsonii 30446]|uniref:Endoribonuclease YbeY n=1 Tax=Brachyspira hampsonii 30446 TaxID=1289135 RepID=A0A2U4F5D3_9SPIR|nr:rRNA maturation RNase YbeY [Brachyspira hampsonii]EKV57907.1 putative metal-dependent hydrolase [Brachyspira hampsonii 30446]MBW5395194.1 rRNA maturation RNase YbeY [Brachyspira hampsonii]OEJ15021.1 rRNA maturation RNase YbeY [Brachyspira hampsonii]